LISLETGKSSEAIVRLSAWLEQFPDRPEASNAYLTLGQCFREMQATYRAREAFYRTLTSAVAKAAKSDKVDLSTPQLLRKAATWEIAESEYQSANWERAEELFQRFREQNPESTELSNTALYRQADCVYQLGDMAKSTEKYETALAVSPFHPFAPEAHLRLITLYGIADNPKKQSQALESFIWIVKNLHQDQSSYWQQRCAALLLDNLKSDPQKQSALLNELVTFQSSEELKGIFDYYKILLSRTENTIQSISANGKKQRDEGWNDWKESLAKMQAKIENDLATSTQLKAENATTPLSAP
jgi:TolA-binding protein